MLAKIGKWVENSINQTLRDLEWMDPSDVLREMFVFKFLVPLLLSVFLTTFFIGQGSFRRMPDRIQKTLLARNLEDIRQERLYQNRAAAAVGMEPLYEGVEEIHPGQESRWTRWPLFWLAGVGALLVKLLWVRLRRVVLG